MVSSQLNKTLEKRIDNDIGSNPVLTTKNKIL